MALLGNAALAMWWNMTPAMKLDFEDWHTHEHFPERLGVPGFRRASRWLAADGGEGVFVLYELEGHEVLSSPAYLARLNAPTPWSTRLMPHHRDMVRSQNEVLESAGASVSRFAMTTRLSPQAGRADGLRAALASEIARIATTPGLAGAHLLRHRTPDIAATTEQKIRGVADRVADWTLLVCAYDGQALDALGRSSLSADSLVALGAQAFEAQARAVYALSSSATPGDTR